MLEKASGALLKTMYHLFVEEVPVMASKGEIRWTGQSGYEKSGA
jgi:hypothetical protein